MIENKANERVIDIIDIYIGSNIRCHRNAKNISQTELGKVIGVTFQQIQKYENGVNKVSACNLYKIAKFLNIDIKELFFGIELFERSRK